MRALYRNKIQKFKLIIKKISRKTRKILGFTLIELLVVIAILGLLASLILVAMNGARAKARDAKRVADLRALSNAFELYYSDNGKFACHTWEDSDSPNFLKDYVTKKYIASTIKDPINVDPFRFSYMTLKNTPGGTCGQIIFMEFNTEDPATCPLGGQLYTFNHGTHCHIFYPSTLPAPCNSPLYLTNPDSCGALMDTAGENDY